MQLVDPMSSLPEDCRGGVIAIGNFDGLHRGHARLLAALRDRASQLGRPAVAVTFDPHPARLLRPQFAPTPLVTLIRRTELLEWAGVDRVVVLKTTTALLELSAEQFWRDVIVGRFAATGLVEGHDFAFGKNRGGNVESLKQWTSESGLPFSTIDAVENHGEVVSSTRIRKLLASSELEAANELLGKPHRVEGRVSQGDGRGRTIGFPTANLDEIEVLVPGNGVYAGWAHNDLGVFVAACNIGPNPTFGIDAQKVEIHLLDFEGDLYGRTVAFDCVAKLRDVIRFDGVSALKAQLATDIARAREILQNQPKPSPQTERLRELSNVIREWLALHYATDTPEFSGRPNRIELDSRGSLQIEWQLRGRMLPSDRSEFFLGLPNRLRRVFPEVAVVELRTAGDTTTGDG